MRMRCHAVLIAVAGAIAVAATPTPSSAQELNRAVRTLDRILNPEDARRYEERSRREHRPEEERYWHDYGAGLQAQHRDRDRGIGVDETRRLEAEARRNHRSEEERYWRDYRRGLDQGRR